MKKKKLLAGILFFTIAISLGYYTNFFSPQRFAGNLFSYMVYPVLVMHNKLVDPIKLWLQDRHALKDLRKQLQENQEEKELLLNKNISLQATLSYLEDIKELHEFKKRYEYGNAITAQILVRHFSDQSHYFLVDAGARQGIVPDMVVVYNNCLVGKVVDVYPWYSKVYLITDRLCKVAAYCSTSKANGIHEGINEEAHTMLQYVSHLNEVHEGDMVISSGEGTVFPQGFALGTIAEKKQDGLYHHVRVTPLIDLRTIQYCLIMPKGKMRPGSSGESFASNLNA